MFAGAAAQEIERLLDEAVFDFRILAQLLRETPVPLTQWTSRFSKKQAGGDSRFSPRALRYRWGRSRAGVLKLARSKFRWGVDVELLWTPLRACTPNRDVSAAADLAAAKQS